MKTLKLLTLFTIAAFLFAAPAANAVMVVEGGAVIVEETTTAPTMTKKQERQLAKMEKRMAKMEKRMAKRGQSMEDEIGNPVSRWLWFWLLSWLLAVVLIVVAGLVAVSGGFGIGGILLILGYLFALFGTVSFIIWLIKLLT